ncbi:hypothetical protein [Cytobacillus oceanisediminis]|uniref:hypothetical protein n=1 Tax=Cytobacillus oceanisediminis TaxID=665099 RepID=UPI0002DE0572|nr:hypothetical protein [Cytobacillus oceanisediminis]
MKTLQVDVSNKTIEIKDEVIQGEPSVSNPPVSELEAIKKQQADLVLELMKKGVL